MSAFSLTSCGDSSEVELPEGTAKASLIDDQASVNDCIQLAGEEADALIVDVKSTDHPGDRLADLPLPEGAIIESFIELGDTVTVT